MDKSILIQAWGLYKCGDSYYVEYTHYVYIKNIKNIYSVIHLISSIKPIDEKELYKYCELPKDILVYHIPYFTSYISAYKHFAKYLKVYNKAKLYKYDAVYTRFPSPFGWLQKIFFKGKRIVHFVGDPLDTVIKNQNLSILKKIFKCIAFLPEYLLFIWASCGKNVKVYSNGHHISNKLKSFNIKAKPMISSTLEDSDFFKKNNNIEPSFVKLIYVGYLRKAKGVDTIINAFKILNDKYPNKYSLTIVGAGEENDSLVEKSKSLNIEFLGHIDNREYLNSILRNHHIFCFASLSEGSPRVILEAIANGLNIVSTPVGSLPYIFKDGEDLLYFDYNNHHQMADKIVNLSKDIKLQNSMRESSINKVKGFKISNFINEVFDA